MKVRTFTNGMSIKIDQMKHLIFIAFIVLVTNAGAQNIIEWDGKYQLRFSDFQSAATKIGGTEFYGVSSGDGMLVSFNMPDDEFLSAENFNPYVDCSFDRKMASLVAPDSVVALDLLLFARYEFDLSELFARKMRKKLLEEKGEYERVDLFKPAYDEIQSQYMERHKIAAFETDWGYDREKLKMLHSKLLKEIEQLSDFCKTCTPKKKK